MQNSVKQIKRRILPILKRNGVRRAGLFGSIARGQGHRNSDIDLLVELKRDFSLLDFVGLKLELEEKLHLKVDLVEYDCIKPFLRKNILEQQIPIL